MTEDDEVVAVRKKSWLRMKLGYVIVIHLAEGEVGDSSSGAGALENFTVRTLD